MLSNEERELQIELTRLQVKHEHEASRYTISISVFLSLIISVISVYVPLGASTGNWFYLIYAGLLTIIIAAPLGRVWNDMNKSGEALEKEIEELKKKYLW